MSVASSPDGVTLAFEEYGPRDAPAIVFLHGLGFVREVWHRQLESDLAKRFHLVAYDLRGHGRSTRPSAAEAYEDGDRWGADLDAVLRATHAKAPVIVGWSLGAVSMMEYLRTHGDGQLAGLVFVAGVTKYAPELFAPTNHPLVKGLAQSDDAARQRATVAFVGACFAKPVAASELDPLIAASGVLPASEHVALQHMKLGDTEAALRAVHKPALVIHGAMDLLVAEAMARYTMSLVPGAKLSIYEGSGHAPFFDETARFNEELTRFVEAANATTAASGDPSTLDS